jgi:hypothetical protein
MWLIKIGHNDRFNKISPGIVLTHEMIKYAIAEKLNRFEFLGSTETWINLWKPQIHQYKACIIYPINPSGLIQFAIDAIRVAKKRLY